MSAVSRRMVLQASLGVAVTSACGGIPTNQSVEALAQIDEPAAQILHIRPDGPSPDSGRRQTVLGFIRAHISAVDNYGIAREFLVGKAKKNWAGHGSVDLFSTESDLLFSVVDTNTVQLTLRRAGSIDQWGRRSFTTKSPSKTWRFTLTSTTRGWRISQVPASLHLLLSISDLSRLYTRANVYFPAKSSKVLVPDARWFPNKGLVTASARACLAPPSEWLEAAVDSPFPLGTDLLVDSVAVERSQGTAVVDLSPQALQASDDQRLAMWAVFMSTLTQVPGVRSVRLTVEGHRLDGVLLPSDPDSLQSLNFSLPPTNAASAVVRQGNSLQWRTIGSPQLRQAKSGDEGRIVLPSVDAVWDDLAVHGGGRQLAAINTARNRLRVWVNGRGLTFPAFGKELLRPQFDYAQWLWIAGKPLSGVPSQVWVAQSGFVVGKTYPSRVFAPWVGRSQVLALQIASEGARAALILRDSLSGSTALYVAAVRRNGAGRPVELMAGKRVANMISAPSDVVWADTTHIAVLGYQGRGKEVFLVPIDGGEPVELGRAVGAVSLRSAMRGKSGIYVRTTARTLLGRFAGQWLQVADVADFAVDIS